MSDTITTGLMIRHDGSLTYGVRDERTGLVFLGLGPDFQLASTAESDTFLNLADRFFPAAALQEA